VFETFRPEVVFHAAAHKHVHLMETNPCEAITNNVTGTRNLVEQSLAVGVSRFVQVSTDKAVNPTS
jgi:FlaA1/EpsC-like NDP-sugar epimerase